MKIASIADYPCWAGCCMFGEMQNAKIIREGICLYDDTKPYEVRIIEWHTWYGSGDGEDSPEISDDKDIRCFYVWFEDLINRGIFSSCGGPYLTIEEAISSIEESCNVKWKA